MKGIILTYQSLTPTALTELNNRLFGRVVKVVRNKKVFYYYYKGILHSIQYYQLSKGCYFIPDQENLAMVILYEDSIKTVISTIDISDKLCSTAEQIFRNKYRGKEVINL